MHAGIATHFVPKDKLPVFIFPILEKYSRHGRFSNKYNILLSSWSKTCQAFFSVYEFTFGDKVCVEFRGFLIFPFFESFFIGYFARFSIN